MTGNYAYRGRSSIFYTYSGVYHLTIKRTIFGRVKIKVEREYQSSTLGSHRTYRNIEAFNKEWEKI